MATLSIKHDKRNKKLKQMEAITSSKPNKKTIKSMTDNSKDCKKIYKSVGDLMKELNQ